MIRWERQGEEWVGFSGELAVAKVAKDAEAEGERWIWQVPGIKRPNGWRKPLGHRTTSLDARRSAEDYWAKWLTAAALTPDVAQLARESLGSEPHSARKSTRQKPRRAPG